MIKVRNLGRKSLEEVIQKLNALGLSLMDEPEEVLMGLPAMPDFRIEADEDDQS